MAESPVGRQEELNEIIEYVRDSIADRAGGNMYVVGLSGQGKGKLWLCASQLPDFMKKDREINAAAHVLYLQGPRWGMDGKMMMKIIAEGISKDFNKNRNSDSEGSDSQFWSST